MSSTAATIASAVIIASPAWAGIAWNARTQQRRDRTQSAARDEQTDTLKAHITATAANQPDHPKDEDA